MPALLFVVAPADEALMFTSWLFGAVSRRRFP